VPYQEADRSYRATFSAVTAPIGILVNPRSGGDIRRAVAAAGRSTIEDKVSIVRRLVLGARATGVDRVVVNHDPHQIVRRATETIRDVELITVTRTLLFTEEDSTRAAVAMRDAGCAAIAVLGGDGTNRAVVKGWPDVPVIPVSTGTNNAFPEFIEPTVAGTALGLVARGVVALADCARAAKLVHVSIEGGDGEQSREPDIALIDAVAVADLYVGSLELFDPDTMRIAVLTRADPAAIGFAGVAGLLEPLAASEDDGLLLRFAPVGSHDGLVIEAPTAPGHHDPIGIAEVRRLSLGETVSVTGPVLLAFDGERKRRVYEGQAATLSVERDGPLVIDPHLVMADGRFAFHRPPRPE
jgi:hypothetical protein